MTSLTVFMDLWSQKLPSTFPSHKPRTAQFRNRAIPRDGSSFIQRSFQLYQFTTYDFSSQVHKLHSLHTFPTNPTLAMSAIPSDLSFPYLSGTLGATEKGTLLGVFLFGIETLQTFHYYRHLSQDSNLLKAVVCWEWRCQDIG